MQPCIVNETHVPKHEANGRSQHSLFWMMVKSSSVPLSLKLAQVWKSLAKPTMPVTSKAILSVTLFTSSSAPGGMLAMLAITLSSMAMTSGKPRLQPDRMLQIQHRRRTS